MKICRYLFILVSLLASTNLEAETLAPDTSYTAYQTWQKIRKKYPDVKIALQEHQLPVTGNYNQVYATVTDSANGPRELHLDIFRPQKPGKYPALIMIHGGGWRSGNKSLEAPMAQRIALRGYVAVPVEYRLSTEARYPAAIHDIKAAIRWIKANAGKYSIDTTRIAIEGESAGGQLAMLVGMTNNVSKFEGTEGVLSASSCVQAVIDVDGVVDFMAPASLKTPRKPDSPDAYWLGGTFEEKPLIWKDASPIFLVNEHSVPVLFICSTQPRFHAGRDEMIDMLNQHKIYSETHTIPDSPHSFWLLHPWFEPTVGYMVHFLDKVFK
ncbi:MAG: alpha/beta hydrolase [Paludibacter sp.]